MSFMCYLCEGELEPGHGEHDLRYRYQQVLGHDPGEVQLVGRVGGVQDRGVEPAAPLAHREYVHPARAQRARARALHVAV